MKTWCLLLTFVASCEGCGAEAPAPPPPPGVEPPPSSAQSGEEPPASGEPPGPPPASTERVAPEEDPDAPPPPGDPAVPLAPPQPLLTRAELASIDRATCHRLLRRAGVELRVVPPERAAGVDMPVLLTGAVGGVAVRYRGRRERNSIIDCRLAVALAGWAPTLRSAGVERLEHMSIYRPGSLVRSTGRPSGHAAGTAIDVSHLVRPDEGTLEVERDWSDKTPGAEPCDSRDGEPEPQRLLRRLVCVAVEADLFQVVVTPHGDERHHNHVHLEIRPDVDWSHVR